MKLPTEITTTTEQRGSSTPARAQRPRPQAQRQEEPQGAPGPVHLTLKIPREGLVIEFRHHDEDRRP